MGRLNDLTGQKFGRLTVIERAENKGKETMWHCKCDCGNEKDINSTNLTKGLTRSCGCLAKETTSKIRYKDITGNRYGMLTVVERVKAPVNLKRKSVYYSCKCDCGNMFVTEKSRIVGGVVKSCGCYKSKKTHETLFKDLTGKRFGRLTVLELEEIINGKPKWKCRCDCGNEVIIDGSRMKSGTTKSCGCLAKEIKSERSVTHGKSKTNLYRIYNHMKGRCYNPTDSAYENYGGRGIRMCQEWLDDFMNFYNWSMNNGYKKGLTIDRIDNDGDYEPSNCRWADNITQCNNRRSNRKLTVNSETHTIAEWSRITGVGSSTIINRLNNGVSPKMALREVEK